MADLHEVLSWLLAIHNFCSINLYLPTIFRCIQYSIELERHLSRQLIADDRWSLVGGNENSFFLSPNRLRIAVDGLTTLVDT